MHSFLTGVLNAFDGATGNSDGLPRRDRTRSDGQRWTIARAVSESFARAPREPGICAHLKHRRPKYGGLPVAQVSMQASARGVSEMRPYLGTQSMFGGMAAASSST